MACERGYHAIAVTLIEAGADVDNKNEDERTPLHLAAKEGRSKYGLLFLQPLNFLEFFPKDLQGNTQQGQLCRS